MLIKCRADVEDERDIAGSVSILSSPGDQVGSDPNRGRRRSPARGEFSADRG
jgi:hypothetical protein